jgi:signal transduction histidine kinase
LVAGVAHEINNPINFIHGNLSHTEEYTQELLKLVALYQQESLSAGVCGDSGDRCADQCGGSVVFETGFAKGIA